jgi:aspartate kinase
LKPRAPVVIKFGGAALEDVPALVRHLAASAEGRTPIVVVVSARLGVTDLLRSVVDHPRARAQHDRALGRLARLHPRLDAKGREQLRQTRAVIARVERSRTVSRSLTDLLLSQGERLAAHWLARELADRGLPALPVAADDLGLVTNNAYGQSLVLLDRSRRRVRRNLARLLAAGRLPVVTGFFGRSLQGRVATLGRGGSDYSASAIGAILGARRVELVKARVPVLTADPRLVPRARPIGRLSYAEAEELAQLGAHVLHPLAVDPARVERMELRVLSLAHPGVVTSIGAANGTRTTRAVTLLTPLRLLRVRAPGGRQRPGIVAEVSRRLNAAEVNAVTLFTSSAVLNLVLEPAHARLAWRALSKLRGRAVEVERPIPVALVTAVGDGILTDVGRLPDDLLRAAKGFSATARSLSLAVPMPAGPATLRALHRALVVRPNS